MASSWRRRVGRATREGGVLLASFRYYRDRFQSDPEAAREYLSAGRSRRATRSWTRSELAAYATLASLILNLDADGDQGIDMDCDRDTAADTTAFLRKGRRGLGIAALASLLRRGSASGGGAGDCRAAAFRAHGEARDLPVPVGRAVADGSVRLQAAARRSSPGTELPDSDADGAAADRHDVDADELSGRAFRCSSFAQHGNSGAWVSELMPHTGKGRGRALLHQVDAHGGDQSRSGRHVLPDGLPACRPAVASAPGWPMGWAARTRICRRLW